MGYIEVLLSRMKVNPKYDKSCSLVLCFDGIKGRQLRGRTIRWLQSQIGLMLPKVHPLTKGGIFAEVFASSGLEVNELKPRWTSQYDENKEADDLIAELCLAELLKGNKVVILSGDADLFQLLRYPDVRIQQFPSRDYGRRCKRNQVWSHSPTISQIGKPLAGDSSDNIPGVHGIGEKKAASLLEQYGTLESIYLRKSFGHILRPISKP